MGKPGDLVEGILDILNMDGWSDTAIERFLTALVDNAPERDLEWILAEAKDYTKHVVACIQVDQDEAMDIRISGPFPPAVFERAQAEVERRLAEFARK